ncbi:MAG: hypothetical protein LIO90_09330 [Bacteroidales bacterium]|nr:hypothetical protein [Bacteroidales bacterium]
MPKTPTGQIKARAAMRVTVKRLRSGDVISLKGVELIISWLIYPFDAMSRENVTAKGKKNA